MTEPFTEIREFLTYYANVGNEPVASNAKAALAALVRLEREAAERETALAERETDYDDAICARNQAWEREETLSARVREVEAERDRLPLDSKAVLWIAALDRVPIKERVEWVARMKLRVDGINAHRAVLASPEAASGRIVHRDPDDDSTTPGFEIVASPEAAAAEPQRYDWSRPSCGVEHEHDSSCFRVAALPAVDAPPEPTT